MKCPICEKEVMPMIHGAHLEVHFIFGEARRLIHEDGRVEYVKVVKAVLNAEKEK